MQSRRPVEHRPFGSPVESVQVLSAQASSSLLALSEMTYSTAKIDRMMTPMLLLMMILGAAQALSSPVDTEAQKFPTLRSEFPKVGLPEISPKAICTMIFQSLGKHVCDKYGIGDCFCKSVVNNLVAFVCE